MEWALVVLRKREQLDVLKRGEKLIRGSFGETLEDPDGQIESVLPASQEVIHTEKKPRKNKEISLVTADDLECLNFRFATDNLIEEESLLHLSC